MIKIGWCGATDIFDAAMEAAYKLVDEVKRDGNDSTSIIYFAKVMRDVLEAGDWDCQQESDYYQDLKWDLWPELEEDFINDLKEYPWEGVEYEDREGILHRYSELAKCFYHPFYIKCNDPDCSDYKGE